MNAPVNKQEVRGTETIDGMPGHGAAAAGDGLQFITFTIGDESYGVDIMAVREIKVWSEITRLPEQPDFVRGVLNLRGAIVPIADLRCRFGQGLTEATALHVVIIVQIDGQLIGLLADRVSDIVTVDPAKIKPVPKIGQNAKSAFLSGIVSIESDLIALIELSRLLSLPETETLIAAAQSETAGQAA
jgi:purine-binding chemotaxis protein CheW